METEDPTCFEKIVTKLKENNVSFIHTNHAPVRTSQEAAEIRGSNVENGAKAILINYRKGKEDTNFALCVMSASKKLDGKKIRKILGSKSLKFAEGADEVKKITGCLPGAVPPFGSVFGVATFMDLSLRNVNEIDFNAGLRTDSIRMSQKDYEMIEKPIVGDFAG